MKLKKIGRAALALAASAVTVLGMTSCTLSYTVGYLFVTGSQYNQIASYRIQNDNGALHLTSTVGSGGTNPIQVVVNAAGTYLYVLNYGSGTTCKSAAQHDFPLFYRRVWRADLSDVLQSEGLQHEEHRDQRQLSLCAGRIRSRRRWAQRHAEHWRHLGVSMDPATGRLTTILNNQQRDSNNLPLTYFPVGTNPTWMS